LGRRRQITYKEENIALTILKQGKEKSQELGELK